MRALKFLIGLALVFFIHIVAVRVHPAFPRAFDLFLVLVVLNALDGNTLAGLLGGVVAGLVEDGVSGAYYGLHGIADSVVGYFSALACQQLEIQRPVMVGALFSLAAALQQTLLVGLLLLLLVGAAAPELPWLAAKIVSAGALGAALVVARGLVGERLASRHLRRVTKVRI